jgi:hypothetical protein
MTNNAEQSGKTVARSATGRRLANSRCHFWLLPQWILWPSLSLR